MQLCLQAVGVNVEIGSYEWSTFREKLNKGLQICLDWFGRQIMGDPDNFYRPLLSVRQ